MTPRPTFEEASLSPKQRGELLEVPGEEYDPLFRSYLATSAPLFALLAEEEIPTLSPHEIEVWEEGRGEEIPFFEIVAPIPRLLIPWHRKKRKKGKKKNERED